MSWVVYCHELPRHSMLAASTSQSFNDLSSEQSWLYFTTFMTVCNQQVADAVFHTFCISSKLPLNQRNAWLQSLTENR